MEYRSKLLKVVSILMIIFGAFGLIHDVFVLQNIQLDFVFLISMMLYAICMVAGFYGILGKSKKIILILGILLCLVVMLEAMTDEITDAVSFVLLILPLMYLLGWHKSRE